MGEARQDWIDLVVSPLSGGFSTTLKITYRRTGAPEVFGFGLRICTNSKAKWGEYRMSRSKTLRTHIGLFFVACMIPLTGLADDMDDVGAVIDRYIATETNLAEQARLMTDDRTYIAAGVRSTDNVANMKGQIAGEKLRQALDPDGMLIVTAEDPMIKVYGDTAVASFYRHWVWVPGAAAVKAGQVGNVPPSQVVTLVLNKQRGDWKIVHTHISLMAEG